MPIWEPASRPPASTPADVTSALHYDPAAAARRRLPAPPRAARRHHPDPAADHPERRLDRRRVPDARARVLPVRRGRPRPAASSTRPQLDAIRRAPRRLAEPPTAAAPPATRSAETGLSPALDRRGRARTPARPGQRRARPGRRRRSAFEPEARAGRSTTSAAPATAACRRRTTGDRIPIPRPPTEAVERVRQHPYVRLALNGSFSALWAGQLITLFGDRIHQLALVAVVADRDGLGARDRRSSSSRPRCRTCS